MTEFRKVFPGDGRIIFDGGLNTKFPRSIISDNESPDCANVRFKNGVETRGGSTKINTAAIGSFVGDGLYTRHDDTGAQTMLAFAGGTMWALTGTSFITVPSAQSIFTAGARVTATEYQNVFFVGNGGIIPHKYTGIDFTRHGVYPPTATSTVNSQATGVLTGGYQYKVTNVNSFAVESDVGPVSATFTAASATLRVTLQTFTVSFGINSRVIYRTVAGGTIFKRVATVANNTATTYDDNIADASLGTTAPTDNGLPPNYSVCMFHRDRLFVNDPDNPNYLWYSELGEPYTFKSTNFLKIGDATADLIRTINTYGNDVMVGCDRSPFLVYMPDTNPTNWSTRKVQSPYGTKSPFGLFEYNKRLMYPAIQTDKFTGFAAMDGIAVAPSTTFLTVNTAGSLLQSETIEPEMFKIQFSYIGNISSIVYQTKAYISVTHDTGATQNNRIWVYDFSYADLSKKQKGTWQPDTGVHAAQFTVYNGNLYYISSLANGFVYQYETLNQNDDGVAIDSYFWTKEFTADGSKSQTTFKDFRYTKLLVDTAGDYFMNFGYRVNSDAGNGNFNQIDLNPGGSIWGTMVWGRDLWGGGSVQDDKKIFLGAARGERIQFQFSNQNKVAQRFKVHGLRFYFNSKGFR